MPSPTSVLDAPSTGSLGQWERRPVTAAALRVIVFLLPLLTATALAYLLASALPAAESSLILLAQRTCVMVIALAVAWLSRPLAKRLLPLSTLLELTLVFPDQAPSRMATGLRARSEDELADLLERTRNGGLPTEAGAAAEAVLTLVAELSRHDRITRGHSERVRVYASMIAREMGLPAEEIERLGWAGLLHDIGKLTIDDAILNKPSRLTAEEYDIIKTHAAEGSAMVAPLRGWLGSTVDAVGQHHERWDGNGYPNGLAGEEISLAARIMSVADVFDVITAVRSYKSPSSPADARMEIAAHAGTQFDPAVVRAFLAISIGDFKVARGPLAVLAQIPIVASLTAPAVAGTTSFVTSAAVSTAVIGSALALPGVTPRDSFVSAPSEMASAADVASVAYAASIGAPVTAPPAPTSAAESTTGPAPSAGGASSSPLGTATSNTTRQEAVDRDHRRAVEKAVAEAQAARNDIVSRRSRQLAEASEAHDEDRAQIRADHAEAIAKAVVRHEQRTDDLADDRRERDEKIEEIDRDLEENLAQYREDRDADLQEVDEDEANGDLTASEAEQERRAIRAEFDERVVEAKADADQDRAKAREDVAEAEAEAEQELQEATRRADSRRDENYSDLSREYNADRARIQEDADEDLAKVQEDLDETIARLEREYTKDRAKAQRADERQ